MDFGAQFSNFMIFNVYFPPSLQKSYQWDINGLAEWIDPSSPSITIHLRDGPIMWNTQQAVGSIVAYHQADMLSGGED